MSLPKKTELKLNEQICAEYFSAYLYKSMEAYFESIGFKGFAHWMSLQAIEELEHGNKIFDYVNERKGRVNLEKIDKPKEDWQSPLDAFEDAFAHEQKVTSMINEIVEVAILENDYKAKDFLQWFVDEQVEEEESAKEIVDKLKIIGSDKVALFELDSELSQRGK